MQLASSLDPRARAMALERARLSRAPHPQRIQSLQAVLGSDLVAPPGHVLAPTPEGALPVLGHLRHFSRGPDRLRAVLAMRHEYGDVVRLRFGSLNAHLIADPALVEEILQKRNREFRKSPRGLSKLKLVLGKGLLTSEGGEWLRQRRIAQPAFHRKRLALFADRMVEAAESMSAGWQDGATIDAHDAMMRVTLRIVGETLLGTDVTADADDVGPAVSFIVEDINQRVNRLIDIAPPIPTPRNLQFRRAMDTLDRIVLGMIEQRRREAAEGAPPKHDLLAMFMEAEDVETGERMSDMQLRDEVMTMFLAGHETTANALSWALHLLSKNPAVMRELQAEVDAVIGDRRATVADVPKLQFTKQVVQEAMRLYPPAWMLARSPIEDTTLGGYYMPKDCLLFISPWVVQRHPDHWEDPEGFDPRRFEPERVQARHRFAYFPFGGGPRLCIGSHFAMMEAQLVLATLVKNWRLDLIPGHPVVPEPVVTLRPRGGLPMVAHAR